METAAIAQSHDPKVDIAQSLLARARDLVPRLRARAQDCERRRQVGEETIADFIDAGLLRASQPARYRGYELGWDVLCEISQTLAAGCGSQAWVQWVFNDHAHMLSTFPAEAQDDAWGGHENSFVSASFDPVGRARRVDGGFVFSGRHGFASGIDYARWLICGGSIVENGRLDGPHFFLVPKDEVAVIDDWHTMGLEGTGSKSFVVEEKFVPAHRWLDGRLAHQGTAPGTRVNTSYVYRLPRGGVTSTGFASVAIGMAQGVLHEWLASTGPRKSRGVAIAALQSTHVIAGECSAEIDAANALCLASIRDVMRKLARGEEIDAAQRIAIKRNVAFACQLALKAGTRLFNSAGGRSSASRPCSDNIATSWRRPRITASSGTPPRPNTAPHCSRPSSARNSQAARDGDVRPARAPTSPPVCATPALRPQSRVPPLTR